MITQDMENRMAKAIEAFQKDLSGLRTSRASANLLENIKVDLYGNMVPINQVGTVSVPEARLLMIQVWDKSTLKNVEKSILEANLGLNPVVEGQVIRIPMPDLTEERRKELVKIASKYAEGTRIVVRNIRRDGIDDLRQQEKKGEISEDTLHRLSQDIQKITDDFIKKIDELVKVKEKDIMHI